MATFELTDTDGSIYDLEAPDHMAAFSAFKKMKGMGGYDTVLKSQSGGAKPGNIGIDAAPQYDAMGNFMGGVSSDAQRDARQPGQPVGYAEDIAKSIGTGLTKGVMGVVGLPFTAARGAEYVGLLANRLATGETYDDQQARIGKLQAENTNPSLLRRGMDNLNGDALTASLERNVTGPLHKPQTLPGKYAETVAEFIPSAVAMGPGGVVRGAGNMIRNATAYGIIPGVASEVAGQLTKGTWAEPYARAGAAVVGSVSGGIALAPSSAGRAVSQATRDIPAAQRSQILDQAEQIFQDARAANIPLSRASAVNYVSNGATSLGDIQRVIEGGGRMRPFYADTGPAVQRAADAAFDTIAPRSTQPSQIGPAVGEAALEIAADARQLRTQAVRPAYQAAANDVVPPGRVQAVIAQLDDIIANDATGQLSGPAQQMRAQLIESAGTPGRPAQRLPVIDPRTGNVIRYETTPAVPATPAVPRTNVGQLDEVYGSARDQFTGLAPVGQTGTEARANRLASQAVNALDTELQAASPALAEGRHLYQEITRRLLDPLMRGPIGKLAERDITTKKVIDILFPDNPLPGSAKEVMEAVSNLATRNPTAARMIVRTHLESTFNQATQNLQSGVNQFGGPNFAATIRGNRQQAENLAAAIRGLPDGQTRLEGIDKLLAVMEAQGMRQRMGSATAFNTELQQAMKQSGIPGDAIKIVASAGTKWPARLVDTMERWRLGKNMDELASLFTDPAAGSAFKQLAMEKPGTPKFIALATRLTALAMQGAKSQPAPVNAGGENFRPLTIPVGGR